MSLIKPNDVYGFIKYTNLLLRFQDGGQGERHQFFGM